MPKTSEASVQKQKNGKRKNESGDKGASTSKGKKARKTTKQNRLTALAVSQIILDKNIYSKTELYAVAQEQKEHGKVDLAHFILGRSPKVLVELLTTTWEMEGAKRKIARSKKTRIDLLHEASQGHCAVGCNGVWLQCAKEVLHQNGVDVAMFAGEITESLTEGRGKHRNVMIVGPANCGKTFILKPLTLLYETFCNPASGTFAWVGVHNAECIFLNDFRWSPQVIPWHDLLLMLEGEVVHLPAPKTHFAQDIEFVKDTPIFCTSKRPLMFIKNGVVDDRETEMMAVRWKIFSFNHQIAPDRQQHIPPCAKCFTTLLVS